MQASQVVIKNVSRMSVLDKAFAAPTAPLRRNKGAPSFAAVMRWLRYAGSTWRWASPAASDRDSELAGLRATLAELPALERQVLEQQVRWGQTPAHIAASAHLSEAEVRTALIRARQQLRARCGEDLSGDPSA